jgi:hypothetical protein
MPFSKNATPSAESTLGVADQPVADTATGSTIERKRKENRMA